MRKKINGYRAFTIINTIFMLFIIFIMAYPLYYVVVASFSDPNALFRHGGLLWAPLQPYTLRAYEMVFNHSLILSGFANTLFVLVVGLMVNLTMTVLGAYCLNVKGPMLNGLFTTMIIITMYFGGGLVPGYLNIKDLGLLDSLWALIIPGAITTTNLIIMRSAFRNIPESLTEAAVLDGAAHYQILTRVMIPLSKATLAVMVLYYGVSHWNSWFAASIYLRDSAKYPLQLVVRNIINLTQMTEDTGVDEMAQMAELMKYALIVVSTVPILCIYPFIQKHFTKGVMVGAIKG